MDGTTQECPVPAERKYTQCRGCSHVIRISSMLQRKFCVRKSWTWHPCTGEMLTSKSESNLFNKCRHRCKPGLDSEVKIFWSCANDYKSVIFDLWFRSYLVPFKDTPLCSTPFLLPLLKVLPWPVWPPGHLNFWSWFSSAPQSPFSSEPVVASLYVSCILGTDFFAVFVFLPKQVTVRHSGCSKNSHPLLLVARSWVFLANLSRLHLA